MEQKEKKNTPKYIQMNKRYPDDTTFTQSGELAGATWTKSGTLRNCMGGAAGTSPITPTNCSNKARELNNCSMWNS